MSDSNVAGGGAGSGVGDVTGSSAPVAGVDMSTAPQFDQLSKEEQGLCQALPLLPGHYLKLKQALIRECMDRGVVARDAAGSLVQPGACGGGGGCVCFHLRVDTLVCVVSSHPRFAGVSSSSCDCVQST